MIQDIRNVQVFQSHELSNEDYHKHEYISGSSLVEIFFECVAQWKFGEKEETQALHFGTASHSAVLEPEKFDAEFVCDINKDEDELITSDAALKAWLNHRGIKYKSTAPFSELVELAYKTSEPPKILKLESMILESESKHHGKTIVAYKDYEMIQQMRRVLFADRSLADMLSGSTNEMSIICEIKINDVWIGVKIRPDTITKNCEVPDYKTAASIRPDRFGRDAHDRGYWLKQAFVKDVLEAVYKKTFKVGLLAQCKKSPYIHQLYWLTRDQVEVGRDQYEHALMCYYKAKKADCYPAYFDGATDLPTPDYLATRYGF